MDLEYRAGYLKEFVVINPEDDGNGKIRYRRVDNGKLVSSEHIELLPDYPGILVSRQNESSKENINRSVNSYLAKEANAIVLGEKLIRRDRDGKTDIIYAANFCKARL